MDIPLPYNKKIIERHENPTDKYPNGWFKEKKCKHCKIKFKPIAPSHHYCSTNCAIRAGAEAYLQRNYNITLQTYEQMFKDQNGKCAICNSDGFSLKESVKMSLVIDHSHKTNKVRGLLCPNCNRALGLLKDDKERITKLLKYIDKEPYPSITLKDRLTRNRGRLQPHLTKEEVIQFYNDAFVNNLRTMQLANKYKITRNTVADLKTGRTRKEWYKEYLESATTIQ